MAADPRIYDSDRLAHCYARARPPVHEVICARLFSALPTGCTLRSALDVGCGAGASTAVLARRVDYVVGIDPYLRMVQQARNLVPAARFSQAAAEALPLRPGSIDLVTAAGSLNYADIDRALREIALVLTAEGHLAVYDFSTGRVLPEDRLSNARFLSFETSFPWPPGYALDLSSLPYHKHRLALSFSERFTVQIEMSLDEYITYILGETNVEAAISAGTSQHDARQKCLDLFEPLFQGGTRAVEFSSELALAKKG